MRETSTELRAIAALIVPGRKPQLVGPCTLVTDGTQVVAFSSAELLRQAPEPLAIALTFDCKKTVPVRAWSLCRTPQMGIIEIDVDIPEGEDLDVAPLSIGSVCATIDTRGAPSALVTVHAVDGKIARRIIPVHVDTVEGGGSRDDIITRLASPDSPTDVDAPGDGAALVSWLPADPLLGRQAEVVVCALATAYQQKTFQPRELPALAELHGLDEIGRVLPWRDIVKEASNQLGQVVGEIRFQTTERLVIIKKTDET